MGEKGRSRASWTDQCLARGSLGIRDVLCLHLQIALRLLRYYSAVTNSTKYGGTCVAACGGVVRKWSASLVMLGIASAIDNCARDLRASQPRRRSVDPLYKYESKPSETGTNRHENTKIDDGEPANQPSWIHLHWPRVTWLSVAVPSCDSCQGRRAVGGLFLGEGSRARGMLCQPEPRYAWLAICILRPRSIPEAVAAYLSEATTRGCSVSSSAHARIPLGRRGSGEICKMRGLAGPKLGSFKGSGLGHVWSLVALSIPGAVGVTLCRSALSCVEATTDATPHLIMGVGWARQGWNPC